MLSPFIFLLQVSPGVLRVPYGYQQRGCRLPPEQPLSFKERVKEKAQTSPAAPARRRGEHRVHKCLLNRSYRPRISGSSSGEEVGAGGERGRQEQGRHCERREHRTRHPHRPRRGQPLARDDRAGVAGTGRARL